MNETRKLESVDFTANPEKLITKSKVHDAKTRSLKSLSDQAAEPTSLIFFDGKKTETLESTSIGDGFHHNVVQKKAHYVIADGKSQKYIGEFMSETSTGEALASEMVKFIDKKPGLNIDDISSIGSDGENTNVGNQNGVISLVEKKLGRSLHRFICLLHTIEVILKHFLRIFVGETSGPKSFSSELGKEIVNLKAPIKPAAFKAIPSSNFTTIPDDVLKVQINTHLHTNIHTYLVFQKYVAQMKRHGKFFLFI